MADFTGTVMVGLDGPELTQADRERLRLPAVGAVCLFARNFINKQELIKYLKAVRHSVDKPLLVAVDQEGGRVQRFVGRGFARIPAPRTLGEEYANDPAQAVHNAIERGATIARQLALADIDLTFVPVLDLDYGRNPMIDSRCFASTPQATAALALGFCQGLKEQGMHPIGKHFPGHGWAKADSHFDRAVDRRSKATILENDVLPYVELLNHQLLSGVMLSHVNYPKLAKEPATYAAAIVKILRKDLGFTGKIMTDDLVMEGADIGNQTQRVIAAAKAGVELLLVVGGEPMLHDSAIAELPASGNRVSPWLALLRSDKV